MSLALIALAFAVFALVVGKACDRVTAHYEAHAADAFRHIKRRKADSL